MNFLNRRMFANGGDVLPGLITDSEGRTITVDPNEFKQKISGLTDSQVFAFAKDVEAGNRVISDDLKSILNQEANFRDVPFFPGRYSFGAFAEDSPRVATKILGPIARFGLLSTTSPRTRQLGLPSLLDKMGLEGDLKNITEYKSDLTAPPEEQFDEERVGGLLDTLFTRGGRSPEELDFGISSLFDTDKETVSTIDDQPAMTETVVTAKRIDPMDTIDLDARPEAPKNIADFSDDIAKDLEDLESDTAKLNKQFTPEVTGPDSSIVSITQAEADEINKEDVDPKTDEDIDDDKSDDAVTTLVNRPGFFGSQNFLNFIRNVAGELQRTGQFAEGLASGAAKAAEERAARELLADQETRKYKREIELAQAKAGAGTIMKPEKILELNNAVRKDITDFQGGLSAVGFVDYAMDIIKEAQENNEPVGGFAGLMAKMVDKGFAFAGMGRDFDEMSADSKVAELTRVVKQKNLQAILGESGRTISDRDRQIIETVFGDLSAFENPNTTLGKLLESRQRLAQSNAERYSNIMTNSSFLNRQGFEGQNFYGNLLPSLQSILGIDPMANQSAIARARFSGQVGPQGIQEVDL